MKKIGVFVIVVLVMVGLVGVGVISAFPRPVRPYFPDGPSVGINNPNQQGGGGIGSGGQHGSSVMCTKSCPAQCRDAHGNFWLEPCGGQSGGIGGGTGGSGTGTGGQHGGGTGTGGLQPEERGQLGGGRSTGSGTNGQPPEGGNDPSFNGPGGLGQFVMSFNSQPSISPINWNDGSLNPSGFMNVRGQQPTGQPLIQQPHSNQIQQPPSNQIQQPQPNQIQQPQPNQIAQADVIPNPEDNPQAFFNIPPEQIGTGYDNSGFASYDVSFKNFFKKIFGLG